MKDVETNIPELGDYSNLEYTPEAELKEQSKLNEIAGKIELDAAKNWIEALKNLIESAIAKH